MPFGPLPQRFCATPDAPVSGVHAWPADILQIEHRGRWAHQLGSAWPEPVGPETAPVLDLRPTLDMLGASYDDCPCAQVWAEMLSDDPAQLFLLLFTAYVAASGGGPAGITLSAQQLHVLFGTSACRILLEYRAAGAAAAGRLTALLTAEQRRQVTIMARTQILAALTNIGRPPDNTWILSPQQRRNLGDDDLRAELARHDG